MNYIAHSDESFNEVARKGDMETPVDRYRDLILAVFRSNVNEACEQYARHPGREPDAGLVYNAAAWIQEVLMPDASLNEIAEDINKWIFSQANITVDCQSLEPASTLPPKPTFVGFF